MIRDAVLEDMPALIGMGERFHSWSGVARHIGFDAMSYSRTMQALVDAELVIVLDIDGPVGMAAALVYPAWFNAAHMTGTELVWWVNPEHRGHHSVPLLGAIEERARECGATTLQIVHLMDTEASEAAMARLYRGRGYVPLETTYIKEL